MNTYDLMIKTNHHLIRGGKLTDAQKADIVKQLLATRIELGSTFGLYDGTMFHYKPAYFIPHAKKLKTVISMGAQTNQVSDNSYELEIIRLLHKFSPQNDDISQMIELTKERLKKNCFGYKNCFYCECFHASIVVLRFISSVSPTDTHWISKQIAGYNKHFNDRRWHSGVQRYYWLSLSDIPYDIAEPEIHYQKEKIIEQLSRTYLAKNEYDDIPLYAMKNALSRLPEFYYIKDRRPYIDEKTGRLKFNMVA
jgi:hypothetical protein